MTSCSRSASGGCIANSIATTATISVSATPIRNASGGLIFCRRRENAFIGWFATEPRRHGEKKMLCASVSLWLIGFEFVAHAPHRLDELRLARIRFDLLTQAAHVDGHRARIDVFGEAPHVLQQLIPGKDLARVAREEPQQI